jgi:TP901 family phage tail tape measure protein
MGDNRKILIEIVTKTSGAEKKVKKTGDAVEKTGKQADKASKSFFGLGKTLGAIAIGFIIVKGFQLLAQAISGAVKITAEFELIMNKVKAISGATEKEFKKLEKAARSLALGTIFTAEQVGELQLAYSKLGFTTDEILAATEATTKLATITGDDLAGSADVVGATIRGFGLEAVEAKRIVDLMATSFSSSALSLDTFKNSMKTLAPIASAANIDIETTTALLAVLADGGLRGTRAATGLKNVISDLADENSDLSKEVGVVVRDTEDLQIAFKIAAEKGIDLSKASQIIDKRSKPAFLTLIKGVDKVNALTESFNNVKGASDEMASVIEESVSVKFQKFFSAVSVFAEQEGGELLQAIGGLLDRITEFINSNLDVVEHQKKVNAEIFKFAGVAGIASKSTEELQAEIDKLTKANEANAESQNKVGGSLEDVQGKMIETQQFGSQVLQDGLKDKELNKDAIEVEIEVTEDLIAAMQSELDIRDALSKKQIEDARNRIKNLMPNIDLEKEIQDIREHNLAKLPDLVEESIEKIDETFDPVHIDGALAQYLGLTDDQLADLENVMGESAMLFQGLNDLFQTIALNRLSQVQAENDAEFDIFTKGQDAKLDRFDIDQKHELDTFIGTQDQKADFERQKGLERLELLKEQEQAEDALRKKQLQEENKIAKQSFRANQTNAVAQIAIDTALAVMKVFGQTGVAGIALQALPIASGALQTAAVLSQKFQPKTFQDGGMIEGASHSEGGVPFTVAGRTGFEAEGGEYIFSRNTVDRLGTGLLDAINFGGAAPRMFADGGAVSRASTASSALNQSEMAQMIGEVVISSVTQIPVVNVATETDSLSRMVHNAEAMSNI